MIPVASHLRRSIGWRMKSFALALLVCVSLSACTRYMPVTPPLDETADRLIAGLKNTNADLQGFKCLGKMTLTVPDQPVRAFRAVIAGRMHKRLRIDIFAPFGALAGTFASDGWNIFLVMPSTRKYYKLYYGRGSLRFFVQMDVTVADLLELMVGRIPLETKWPARWVHADAETPGRLELSDRSGQVRQRIYFTDSQHPRRSEWFDRHQRMTHTLTLDGRQQIDGYWLPERIELNGPQGARLTMALERYEANAPVDRRLFEPPNPWS